jgi:hypothetical protein
VLCGPPIAAAETSRAAARVSRTNNRMFLPLDFGLAMSAAPDAT